MRFIFQIEFETDKIFWLPTTKFKQTFLLDGLENILFIEVKIQTPQMYKCQ